VKLFSLEDQWDLGEGIWRPEGGSLRKERLGKERKHCGGHCPFFGGFSKSKKDSESSKVLHFHRLGTDVVLGGPASQQKGRGKAEKAVCKNLNIQARGAWHKKESLSKKGKKEPKGR